MPSTMRTKFSHSVSTPSRRGAARVSAIWVIVAFVIALLMAALLFSQADQTAKAQDAQEQAEKLAADNEKRYDDLRKKQQLISEILGFTEDPLTTPSSVEAARALLAEFKQTFPDMEGIDSYEDIIQPAIAALQQRAQIIDDKESRIKEVESSVSAARSTGNETASQKDEIIAQLTRELEDTREQKDAEIARLEETRDQLNAQIRNLTDESVAMSDQVRQAERIREEETRKFSTVANIAKTKLDDIRSRSEKSDGQITAADTRSGLGYISLAASDRLSEGTVFRVVARGDDATEAKAFAMVTDVGPVVSKVRIFDVVDPLGNPVIQGDQLYNPLYEPKSQRNAVLAGTISGIYNEEELRILFNEIGINIQDEVSNTTDFLITGGPIFVDEDGESLETPQQVEDTAVYAAAADQGVVVIPMRDVTQYFRR